MHGHEGEGRWTNLTHLELTGQVLRLSHREASRHAQAQSRHVHRRILHACAAHDKHLQHAITQTRPFWACLARPPADKQQVTNR